MKFSDNESDKEQQYFLHRNYNYSNIKLSTSDVSIQRRELDSLHDVLDPDGTSLLKSWKRCVCSH